MHPTLAPVGTQDPPVDAGALEELDLVAAIEHADLRRAKLVGRIEQSNDSVADLPAFVASAGLQARLREREMRRLRNSPHRVGLPDLLERRTAPARDQRFVDAPEALRRSDLQAS